MGEHTKAPFFELFKTDVAEHEVQRMCSSSSSLSISCWTAGLLI